MAIFALTGARIFTADRFLDDHAVVVDGDAIAGTTPVAALPADMARVAVPGGLLAPGFIDSQVNGGGGVLFNATPDELSLRRLAAAHGRHGSTSLLPTFITDAPVRMRTAIETVRRAIAVGQPGIAGLHLEGPFISVARKGAHDSAMIRQMTDGDVDEILRCGIETLVLTVAPERVPLHLIRRLAEGGVIVSIGHTDASYAETMEAADAGARGVTHVFNAMSQLQHRAPGVVGAALEHGGLWGGIIADGHHVHPVALSAALRAKRGPARLFLVSDAMPTAGDESDVFYIGRRKVTRREGALRLDDGTLAGSDLTMDAALAYAVKHLGVPLDEALRMTSLYPAEFLRLERRKGRIAPGYAADLVHLDAGGSVRGVWIGGRKLDSSPVIGVEPPGDARALGASRR
jgi:N-acetylglucosamine-6-phosphate deacetylase